MVGDERRAGVESRQTGFTRVAVFGTVSVRVLPLKKPPRLLWGLAWQIGMGAGAAGAAASVAVFAVRPRGKSVAVVSLERIAEWMSVRPCRVPSQEGTRPEPRRRGSFLVASCTLPAAATAGTRALGLEDGDGFVGFSHRGDALALGWVAAAIDAGGINHPWHAPRIRFPAGVIICVSVLPSTSKLDRWSGQHDVWAR